MSKGLSGPLLPAIVFGLVWVIGGRILGEEWGTLLPVAAIAAVTYFILGMIAQRSKARSDE